MEGIVPSSVSMISKRNTGFLYVERAKLHRRDNALEIALTTGVTCIPLNDVAAILLGPGTSISDEAIKLIAAMGVTILWVGENGVRYYASAEPLTKKDVFIRRQAELVSNRRSRLRIAKEMYQMRFPDEIVADLSLPQLRGKEGARVRDTYHDLAIQYDYPWAKRVSRIHSIPEGDIVNSGITMATAALYGIVHATIIAIGCSPALGFVHTGHINSFVFDIADLYKTKIAVPVAFQVAKDYKEGQERTLDYEIRYKMRQEIKNRKLMSSVIEDIKKLFGITEGYTNIDEIYLWDNLVEKVPGNTNYATEVNT